MDGSYYSTSSSPAFVQSHTCSFSLSILCVSSYIIIFLCHFSQAAVSFKILVLYFKKIILTLFGSTWFKEREMFYLTTHSTHFIYGYMASDIWLRTILIVRKETRCRHIGYSFRLAARVLLYAPSHRQDNTYHGLCYTSRGALAGTRNTTWFKMLAVLLGLGHPPYVILYNH